MTSFEYALKYTFANEGGYSHIAEDKGGPTNWGITIGDLARWRKCAVTPDDVRQMAKQEAEAIYKAWYWDTLSLDQIEFPKCVAMFDIGVVRGIYKSAKYAQMVCGPILRIDGHIGPKSIKYINQFPRDTFIKMFSELALEGFRGIVDRNPSQKIFLRGWENRAKRLLSLKDLSGPE